MATETTNYKLVKPDVEEFYDVTVPNGNMDKIDAALKALSEALGGIDLATLAQSITNVDQRVTTHLAEDASLANKGHVQLSNATNSTSETMAATSKAIKTVSDVLMEHAGNQEVHVTPQKKSVWDNAYNTAANLYGRFPESCETITDWNNVTKNGMYMALNALNAPLKDVWFMGINIAHNDKWIAQKLIAFGDIINNREFERRRVDGVWSEFVETSPMKLFPSVSNGKNELRSALADKGIVISQDATFLQFATAIRNITSAPKTASGSATTNQYGTLQINGLGFKPTYVKLIATYSGNQREQHYYYPLFGAPYNDGGNTVYPTYGQSSQISTAYAPGGMYEGGFQLPTGITSTVPVSWLASDGILF